MSRVVDLFCSRRVPQVAVLALMSIGFAGCSADMSTRFADNPFNSRSETTGSVRGAPYAAPTPQVQRQELPQYSRPQPQQRSYTSSSLPPPVSAPQSYPSYPSSTGTSGGGRGVSSYDPPARPHIESTGTVAPRSVAAAPAHNHGNGTTIIVGTSDTLEGLSRRYNVSSAEILRANGYKGPRALRPGQQLIIPSRQTAQAQPAQVAPVPAPKVAAAAPAPASAAGTHYVNRGDTLMSIARHNHISVAELARANRIAPNAQLKIGSKIVVPGRKVAAAAPAPAVMGAPPAQLGATAPSVPAPPAQPAPVQVAQAPAEPVQKARMASAVETPAAAAEAAPSPVKSAEATGALPTFRWPVRGRVVAAYGAKTNGKANDGINVAVPEGTPVKAAEDGVVAYAGNELKGYGNLVLVRHSNGYVTAYAHASELMVKRGETIKRGQTIAKSGQSGEAGSPQLHFEIRKGSTPVDPLKFLNGA